ncbi:hypothetical protein Bca4012_011546 [Brassica carinata]
MKAYRKQDGENILLFRPEENAKRMRSGAERMCMPAPSIDTPTGPAQGRVQLCSRPNKLKSKAQSFSHMKWRAAAIDAFDDVSAKEASAL